MGLFSLKKENDYLKSENQRLHELCDVKDEFFKELMADALRHGSSLAGQHMSDRKKYIHGK